MEIINPLCHQIIGKANRLQPAGLNLKNYVFLVQRSAWTFMRAALADGQVWHDQPLCLSVTKVENRETFWWGQKQNSVYQETSAACAWKITLLFLNFSPKQAVGFNNGCFGNGLPLGGCGNTGLQRTDLISSTQCFSAWQSSLELSVIYTAISLTFLKIIITA